MSEEKKQPWHQGFRWRHAVFAAVLLGVVIASSFNLVKLFIYTDFMQRLLGMLQSPLALVPAVILLLLLWNYPKFQHFQKQITLSILYGAGAVLFVVLCGLEMGIDFPGLIETNPPWIYLSALAAVPPVILTWYWKQVNNVKKQDYDEYSEINERFAKATEMLGSKIPEQRIGAIYQLEHISIDSSDNHWTVMETLCAYVRGRSRWTEDKQKWADELGTLDAEERKKRIDAIKPPTDIQAAMTVTGRRKYWEQETEDQRLDFRGADLRGVDMQKGNFSHSMFIDTHLEGADFFKVYFKEANFYKAHLTGANLFEAHCEGAVLMEAHLEGADLRVTHVENANLRKAHFEGANFAYSCMDGADLTQAYLRGVNIEDAQLQKTNFRDAHLEKADFTGSNLRSAKFFGSHLEGADFRSTDLEEAVFVGAELEAANFEGAKLKKANFTGAKYSKEKTQFPLGFNPADHGMINVDELDFEEPDDEEPTEPTRNPLSSTTDNAKG